MSQRVLMPGYANANLNAAVTLIAKDGTGQLPTALGATLLPDNRRIRIAAHGNGVFLKLTPRNSGGATVAATAGTAGELLIPAATVTIVNLGMEWEAASIINAGAGCLVSAHIVEG
jgi:hypothetical protein